jgi:hypothetical protein
MQMPGRVARGLADEEVAVRNPGAHLRLSGPNLFEEAELRLLQAGLLSLTTLCV